MKTFCQTNDNEVQAWETLFKKADKQEKDVVFNWPKGLSSLCLSPVCLCSSPLFPQAHRGLSLHLSPSLLSGLSGSLINRLAVLFYISHLLCSVKGKKKICNTPGL